MVLSPCRGCQERHPKCWDECEAFRKFRAEKKKEKDYKASFKEHNTKRGEKVFAKVKGQV